jgi:hypothetical protein
MLQDPIKCHKRPFDLSFNPVHTSSKKFRNNIPVETLPQQILNTKKRKFEIGVETICNDAVKIPKTFLVADTSQSKLLPCSFPTYTFVNKRKLDEIMNEEESIQVEPDTSRRKTKQVLDKPMPAPFRIFIDSSQENEQQHLFQMNTGFLSVDPDQQQVSTGYSNISQQLHLFHMDRLARGKHQSQESTGFPNGLFLQPPPSCQFRPEEKGMRLC